VARDVVHQGIAHAGAPLARSVVRSYFPLLVLGLALRRTRRLSATLLAAGVLARFVHERPRDPRDVLLGAADDAAYATGVWRGAVTARRWSVLRPRLTWRTAGLALRARDE